VRKIAVYLLLSILILTVSVPASAKVPQSPEGQAAQKGAKKQQKAMKKQSKALRKAQKKAHIKR
jgi:hypothetical protein